MKNLSELSDEQKSVMLAKAMGWKKAEPIQSVMEMFYGKIAKHMPTEVWQTSDGFWIPFGLPNFYNESQMATAWRVLNWAMENIPKFKGRLEETFLRIGVLPYFQLDPNVAQRAWLDEILKLADETGMLEEQNAND